MDIPKDDIPARNRLNPAVKYVPQWNPEYFDMKPINKLISEARGGDGEEIEESEYLPQRRKGRQVRKKKIFLNPCASLRLCGKNIRESEFQENYQCSAKKKTNC